MVKHIIFSICFFVSLSMFSQKDALQLGDSYWEDQLYISVTYNIFRKQPVNVGSSGLSYGFSTGYIKDIPFSKKGDFSAGVGVGYNYDFYNHGLQVEANELIAPSSAIFSNKVKMHNLELPIQFRWRTSDAVTYSFWRVYTGVRMSYNLSNNFSYILDGNNKRFKNISAYNKFQAGLEISAGYGAFNFYVYYGLTPVYKASINNEKVNTKIAKFGLIFYLL